jgi:hypothetical protein
MQYSAQRKLQAKTSEGEILDVVIKIGIPYPLDDDWACSVSISGIHDNISDVRGIDSWQALQLSQQCIRTILKSFIQKGGELFLFGESDAISLEEFNTFF